MCQNENIHRDISLAALLSFASLLGNLATWTDCNYPALRVCVCVCVCVCLCLLLGSTKDRYFCLTLAILYQLQGNTTRTIYCYVYWISQPKNRHADTRELDTNLISATKLLSISADRYEWHSESVLSYKMAVGLIYLSVLKSLVASSSKNEENMCQRTKIY